MTLLDFVSPTTSSWRTVCRLDDLGTERGAAALIDGLQVALFRMPDEIVHAIQQFDPYCGAYVLSRGIVGSRGNVSTVASPMFKQVFDLRTGACLDPIGKEPIDLLAFPTQVVDGQVQISRTTLDRARTGIAPLEANGVLAGAGSAA